MSTDVRHNRATIQWTVPRIAYTPETYTVHFGTSSGSLTPFNQQRQSGDDFTVTNLQFSIQLTGLAAGTTYYYLVVAMNSVGPTASVQQNFTTAPLRKWFQNNNRCPSLGFETLHKYPVNSCAYISVKLLAAELCADQTTKISWSIFGIQENIAYSYVAASAMNYLPIAIHRYRFCKWIYPFQPYSGWCNIVWVCMCLCGAFRQLSLKEAIYACFLIKLESTSAKTCFCNIGYTDEIVIKAFSSSSADLIHAFIYFS